MSNQELKNTFKRTDKNGESHSCTDYEITKARLHCKSYGPGADCPERPKPVRICTSAEDVAFLLDFLHNPETVERSSYKTASCEGKKGSWVSELLGGGTQPVLWLKKNKAQLYEQYKSQCHDSQRKPIGKVYFLKRNNAADHNGYDCDNDNSTVKVYIKGILSRGF